MTHYQDAEDLLPLDELIESILQVWLNPRHPDSWNGSYIVEDDLCDAHDQAPRLPTYLTVLFGVRTPLAEREARVSKRRLLRPDEWHDYQVIRARDLCDAFRADEATIATRVSPDDRPVAYRTVQSIAVIARDAQLEERRIENERIKAASTPEALRRQKEREAEAAKRSNDMEERFKRRTFGIGVRK